MTRNQLLATAAAAVLAAGTVAAHAQTYSSSPGSMPTGSTMSGSTAPMGLGTSMSGTAASGSQGQYGISNDAGRVQDRITGGTTSATSSPTVGSSMNRGPAPLGEQPRTGTTPMQRDSSMSGSTMGTGSMGTGSTMGTSSMGAGSMGSGSMGSSGMRSSSDYSSGASSHSGMSSSGTTSGASYTQGDRRMGADVSYEQWSAVQSNWGQYAPRLRREFSRLSETDLQSTNGDLESLVAVIQERYNLSNQRAHERLAAWLRRAT